MSEPTLDVSPVSAEPTQSLDAIFGDAPESDGFEFAEESQPEPQQQAPVLQQREVMFEIDGKQYTASEDMLKKYYGLPLDAQLTDTEWKTVVSNYKTNIRMNNKNREASNLKKVAEEAFRKLYEDPKNTLKLLFKDNPAKLREQVEALLLEEMEEEMLEPIERENRQLKREREELQKRMEMEEKFRQEQEIEALTTHYQTQIESEIIDAIKTSQIPNTPQAIQRVAYYLGKAAKKGMDLQVKDVVPLVQEDLSKDINGVLASATPEQLLALLGEEKLKQIRQADLQRVKGARTTMLPSGAVEFEAPPKQKKTSMTPEEFRQSVRNKIKGIK